MDHHTLHKIGTDTTIQSCIYILLQRCLGKLYYTRSTVGSNLTNHKYIGFHWYPFSHYQYTHVHTQYTHVSFKGIHTLSVHLDSQMVHKGREREREFSVLGSSPNKLFFHNTTSIQVGLATFHIKKAPINLKGRQYILLSCFLRGSYFNRKILQ